MNKNPFVPQPTYNPPQPPLPPGPPPAAPPDYSAYWAVAAAQQQQQAQPTTSAYNPQWNTPQPQRPSPEQSALYANYGYGGQSLHWQQRQQQPQQHYQTVPPMAAPPPPPPPQPQPQPQYNPYQASVGFQAYVPQAPQPIISQPTYQQPAQPMAPPQPYFQQQHQPQQQQHQPQHQHRHGHGLHHTPPQHLPPAKRQRFDGPSGNHPHGQQRQAGPPPPQPQFQPPPAPPVPGAGGYSQGHSQTQNQQGANQTPLGGNRGGGRGGAGRGRGGSMSGNRGGMGGQRGGRGGGTFMNGGSGRGGGGQQGSLRGHGSRGGFGKQDFHNRRGGSFNAGHQHHQGNMGNTNFRGRGQGHSAGRAGRQDGGAQSGNRDTPSGSVTNSGKKDENRRTLTDFKIVGLEMPELGWTWGMLPSAVKAEEKEVAASLIDSSHDPVKEELFETDGPPGGEQTDATPKGGHAHGADASGTSEVKAEPSSTEHSTFISPPPSRIRIYFHTPVSPDDSHPIPHNSSYGLGAAPMDSRKGKRKKLEDDDGDGDGDDGRDRPPPPRASQMSDTASVDIDGMGRSSVAPSVAETASEGDWLMAAIAEDEGETAEVAVDAHDEAAHNEDENQLRVSRVDESSIPGLGAGIVNGTPIVGGDVAASSGSASEHTTVVHDGKEGHILAGESGSSAPSSGTALGSQPSDADTAPSAATVVSLPEEGGDHVGEPITPETTQPLDMTVENENGNGVGFFTFSSLTEPSHPASQSSTSLSSSFDVASSRASAPPAVQSDVPQLEGEQSTDPAGYPDVQIPETAHSGPKPLQGCASYASTVIDDNHDCGLFSQEEEMATLVNGDESAPQSLPAHDKVSGQDNNQEHLPEPPASPTSNTLLSTSSGSTYGESSQAPRNPSPKRGRIPSANRLSISYAAGTRRLVVDAEVVEYLRVFRAEGRIEVYMSLERYDEDSLTGILIEGLSDTTKSYLPLPTISDVSSADETIPSFSKASLPTKVNLIVHLDTERPLSEPKWVKSGDVQEWLKSMFGRMFWVAGDAADGWEKKIQVMDPDPAPTIWTVLEGWAVNSPVGVVTERQRFLKTHMTESENLLEILLRLVRGERATPFSQTAPAISAPSIFGPLLTALTQSSAHGAQQTHVSLAVLAMFHMTLEYAQKANGEKGKTEAEEKVGEIIRCLPSHLIYKSLDGIFKEWRADKKDHERVTHKRESKVLTTSCSATMFRNTYDSDNTVFSPQGRLHQVEYALEAVKQGSAAVGLRSKTHAILLALKRSTGELASYQQKMFRIDDHVGIAIAGLTSDARVLSNFMRQQAMSERMIFNRPMPVNRLVSSIADKAQVNTQEYGRRPYGVGFLVIGQDQSGPHLFEFSPSGNSYEYFAMSIGARSQSAKTYLEKNYKSFADCTLEELIKHGLHALRETLQQDKELNINNTSVGIIGPSGQHEKPTSPPGKFRIVEGEDVAIYLQSMESKETTEPVAPPPADDDVQMSG
ncbi:hypothetical protein F5I97DRAFT_1952520 [Phlebopus sp. FC_14]|nr:hypothetical protein F5I97DRAFT_1952520 [Phlebopus sp. FC_14]